MHGSSACGECCAPARLRFLAVLAWLPPELKPSRRNLVVITDGKVGPSSSAVGHLTSVCSGRRWFARCFRMQARQPGPCNRRSFPCKHALLLPAPPLLPVLPLRCRALRASWLAWTRPAPPGAAASGRCCCCRVVRRGQGSWAPSSLCHPEPGFQCVCNQVGKARHDMFVSFSRLQGAHRQLRNGEEAGAGARHALPDSHRGREPPLEGAGCNWRQLLVVVLPAPCANLVVVLPAPCANCMCRVLLASAGWPTLAWGPHSARVIAACTAVLVQHPTPCNAPNAALVMQGLTTQRTHAVGDIIRAARRAILCTGTPALSRPVELLSQAGIGRDVCSSMGCEQSGCAVQS